jgi:three-Cys-motif partner protein
MPHNNFFAESSEQSLIKARIIQKYFWAWAKVITPTARKFGNRLLYVDLFAGPGRYDDGTVSTPLLVLEKAIADPSMREMLVTVFNDKDPQNVGRLQAAIAALPGITSLRYAPQILNEVVGEAIAARFEGLRLVPTFFFVDPWGYKGLSLRLINSVLQHWGCDCVFFFNYNRINMGLDNPIVSEHMDALFGHERAETLRGQLARLKPWEREQLIVETLAEALRAMGAAYVLPFAFKNELGNRTSHHLIFATKDFKGYEIMKEIMVKESSERHQGVGSFEYSPASDQFPILAELVRPVDELEDKLLKDFAGRTLSMYDVFRQNCVGTPYIKSNYKRALTNLEAQSKIKADPPSSERPKRRGEVTFGDNVLVTFPR